MFHDESIQKMRLFSRWRFWGLIFLIVLSCAAPKTAPIPGQEGREKTIATERAKRRAYDGAPPVIPHKEMGTDCISCHNELGMEVVGVGYSPPMPHAMTPGLSQNSRCRQCHVATTTEEVFKKNEFAGVPQDLHQGTRLYEGAPPVIPHPVQLRENCRACHDGPAAREEIRTSHPTRTRCLQCHATHTSDQLFSRVGF